MKKCNECGKNYEGGIIDKMFEQNFVCPACAAGIISAERKAEAYTRNKIDLLLGEAMALVAQLDRSDYDSKYMRDAINQAKDMNYKRIPSSMKDLS